MMPILYGGNESISIRVLNSKNYFEHLYYE